MNGLGRKTTAPAAKLSEESFGSCSAVIIITGMRISRFSVRIPLVVTLHSLEPFRPWKAEQLGRGYVVSSWAERALRAR